MSERGDSATLARNLGMFKLIDGEIVPAKDVLDWGRWFETTERRIRRDNINGVEVSTVFLGLDHSFQFTDGAEPVLFETMIFGGHYDGYTERCCTLEEAIQMHERTLRAAHGAFIIPGYDD